MKVSSELQTSADFKALSLDQKDAKIREALWGAKTIGEFLKQHYRLRLEPLLMSLPEGENVLRHCLRYFDPWPDWVLRIAVEVFSVYLPTLKKDLIYDSFRFVHTLILEVRLDGSTQPEILKIPEIDPRVLGAMIGHIVVMSDYGRSMADELLKSGTLSPEKYSEFARYFSTDEFQRELQPHLNDYLKTRPNKWIEMCEAIADAKRKTLDGHGELKETTLTKVYSAILGDWPEIEELSGPTELCTFLQPVLTGSENDPEKKARSR